MYITVLACTTCGRQAAIAVLPVTYEPSIERHLFLTVNFLAMCSETNLHKGTLVPRRRGLILPRACKHAPVACVFMYVPAWYNHPPLYNGRAQGRGRGLTGTFLTVSFVIA